MSGRLVEHFRRFRPRSRLVRIAQIELLLRHTRFQTIVAPLLGLFLVLAFTHDTRTVSAWFWAACLATAYIARIAVVFWTKRDGEPDLQRRLNIYLIGLAAAGILWAAAPHAIAVGGSDGQLIVGLFVSIVVLVGIVGNFLYFQSALLYMVTWIIPALVSIGILYAHRFPDLAWTYTAVVVLFLVYAYKCLEVTNLLLSESLELNEALTQEKERAEASDRAKSDFLAMMSHELRTPLNAIMGYSEIIRDQIFGSNAHEKYSEQAACIREAGGLLSDLISDLLELSALQAQGRDLNIEEVEAAVVVEMATHLLNDAAVKKEIDIEVSLFDDMPILQVDRRAAVQCLTNILGNAVKYSPEGAAIRVEAEQAGAFVLLKVHDSGPGIPQSELGTVTEAFRRGAIAQSTGVQGVGLGLSIAENLMKQQNGSLQIFSQPSEGTTVTLAFPAVGTHTR